MLELLYKYYHKIYFRFYHSRNKEKYKNEEQKKNWPYLMN